MQLIYKNQNYAALLIIFAVFGCLNLGCRSGVPKGVENNVSQLVRQLDPKSEMVSQQPNPKEEAEICIETAVAVAKAGHLKEAIRLYEKALTLSSDDAEILVQLAPLYAQSGDSEQAINTYQRLMETEKLHPDLLNNYAWTLMEAGRLNAAKDLANNGLANFPDSEKLITTLAVINYKQGNRSTAFDLFSKALGQHAAHHNMAVLDVDSENEKNAKAHINKAMQINANPLTVQLSNAINGLVE